MIAREKVVDYLLNFDHPEGSSKARVLARAGFRAARPEQLEEALRGQHLLGDARPGSPSPFGEKYEITDYLTGPEGRVLVTSIWMVRYGESFPRLITVVPERNE